MPTRRRPPPSMRVLATTLVAVLVALLLASAAATLYTRVRVAQVQSVLDQRWLSAQTKVTDLLSTYVDEETGERGFLLTGNPSFLQPYTHGETVALTLQRQLATLLAPDPAGSALLHRVVLAHEAWRQQSALPQIAARRAGPLSQSQIDAAAVKGKVLFDDVRASMADLSAHTTSLIRGDLRVISDVQLLADVVTALTVALALVAGVLALPVTRRMLTRPLEHMLAQLQRVGSGDYHQAIEPAGAAELVAMAESAERMRESLLAHSDELMRAQRTLTLRNERDRLAADLHDRSVQRMFALGLSLSSLATRHPELSPTLLPLIDETDRGIRELRGIIFNLSHDDAASLRQGVDQVVRESARALGFSPELDVDGALDLVSDEETTGELLAVLREALSNTVRHAHASVVRVTVRADGDGVVLVVSDDGVGMSGGPQGNGIRNMQARAERLGGGFDLRSDDTGTVVEWWVPLGADPLEPAPAGTPPSSTPAPS